jgi:phosphate transport system substrate-binding protein
MTPGAPWARATRVAAALAVITGGLLVADAPPAQAASRLRGSGSTYVALAMQQWINDAGAIGVQVDYQPNGSPDGLNQYGQGLMDFAGTEAEFSALGSEAVPAEQRGYQYVPDVAGAVAVMYNVDDSAGRKVDYLRLSPRTIARIFTGQITSWADPAIAEDNSDANLRLPDKPITVVYRSGRSGTTALFYDFVANVEPDIFRSWATANGQPQNDVARVINLEISPNFAPNKRGMTSSDQIAQQIASGGGKWSIGYDEFGYAHVYKNTVARVRNAAGVWQLPYSDNISAALKRALLRADLSQELSGVYTNPDPLTYPISAYSYLVTQCAPTGDRQTCKGGYADPGTAESLAKWMRMIACDGQREMANIGYSPLPTNLSQEMANSVGRMLGRPPEQLTPQNCGNPTFDPGYRPLGAPDDPVEQARQQREGGGGPAANGGSGAGASTTVPGADGADGSDAQETAAAPEATSVRGGPRVGGGSSETRPPEPVEYLRPIAFVRTTVPVAALLLILIVPAIVMAGGARFVAKRRR